MPKFNVVQSWDSGSSNCRFLVEAPDLDAAIKLAQAETEYSGGEWDGEEENTSISATPSAESARTENND